MKGKKLLVAWIIFTLGETGAALSGNEEPLAKRILLMSKTLAPGSGMITCSDYVKIKKSIKPRSENPPFEFYEPEIQGKTPSFVVFEKKTGVLSVCDKGKMTHGKFDQKVDQDQVLDISNAVMKDLNNNGKTDLLVGHLNCVEGPCMGYWYLLEIEPNNLRSNWRIAATSVDVIPGKNRDFLKISDTCFTHEFGSAFSWFFVAEFDKGVHLSPINPKELKLQLPDHVKDYLTAANMEPLESTGDMNDKTIKAYSSISKLIARAYDGEDSKTLLRDFEKISKPFAKSGGLPVHCDIPSIIKNLSDKPNISEKNKNLP